MERWLSRARRERRRLERSLRGGWIHRLLGERVFHPGVWRFERDAIAGGVALGLFVAFTPTIPLQILLCVAGALLLRVNLPAAFVLSWVVNPLTALPVFYLEHALGAWLLGFFDLGDWILQHLTTDGRIRRIARHSMQLWTGAMLVASLAAFSGHLAMRAIWPQLEALRLRHGNRRERRRAKAARAARNGTPGWDATVRERSTQPGTAPTEHSPHQNIREED
jgi:uncharacterized protein